MKPPSKSMIFSMIAVILVFVVLAIVLPERQTAPEDCNLVVINDSSFPMGSVSVSYTRADGSETTSAGCRADCEPMETGESLGFSVEGWPCTVTVYSDVEGRRTMAQFIVERAPAEGTVWQLFLQDKQGGVALVLP